MLYNKSEGFKSQDQYSTVVGMLNGGAVVDSKQRCGGTWSYDLPQLEEKRSLHRVTAGKAARPVFFRVDKPAK